MKKTTLFISATAILLVMFLIAMLVFKSSRQAELQQQASDNAASLVRMHSPVLGRADAPVTIVEFIDPACETCRAFYPLVKDMMAANPERIRLVLRYAPFHPGSDQVVAMLEAARRQGKFWPALEALLIAQADWVIHHDAQPERAWKVLEGTGLDMARLRADMAAPEIARIIAQDLADARTLNVTKTPEYFVNGQPLPSFGYQQLKRLVDEALAAARR